MVLEDWERRLQEHFGDLRRRREKVNDSLPVFALEHGLSPLEIEALSKDLCAWIARRAPADAHWLSWTVYGAELGYQYAGEYWQTFEERTPGWAHRGARGWMRDAYLRFARSLKGARPSGPWAKHFSIICWPTTHAILPRDLQKQFALALYAIRGSFAGWLFESPEELGASIERASVGAASRFRILCEDRELTGRIALALLAGDDPQSDHPLHRATLQRIVADVDRTRSAREWLRAAQSAARLQLPGFSRRAAAGWRPSSAPAAPVHRGTRELGIEPTVSLRPGDGGGWDVWLELPDFGDLAGRFPDLRAFLQENRCTVVGGSGRPLARGALLHGRHPVRLSQWPTGAQPLIMFNNAPPALLSVLRAECGLRPGPPWLFKVGPDGLARQVLGAVVRPGGRYIVVGPPSSPIPLLQPEEAPLRCQGVRAVRIDVPDVLSTDGEAGLRALGLGLARSVGIAPVGLSPPSWDGEGHCEWLSSEQPRVVIWTDCEVKSLQLSLDDSEAVDLDLTDARAFVELPRLKVGVHSLRARGRAAGTSATPIDGALTLLVREPRAWETSAARGGLKVSLDPADATLEQLWEERAGLWVDGPDSHPITLTASLLGGDPERQIASRGLEMLRLPISAERWRRELREKLLEHESLAEHLDDASACALQFDGGELGLVHLRVERARDPVRWAVRRRGQSLRIALIDDTGEPDDVIVTRYDFNEPDRGIDVAAQEAAGGLDGAHHAGLLVARLEHTTQSLVASGGASLHGGFTALGVQPRFSITKRSQASVEALIDILQLWTDARVVQTLVAVSRRRGVQEALVRHIVGLIGGAPWARAEAAYHPPGSVVHLQPLKRAVSDRPEHAALGAKILEEASQARTPATWVVRLADLFRRFVCAPVPSTLRESSPGIFRVTGGEAERARTEWRVEFALRLASASRTLRGWAGSRIREGIDHVLDEPVYLRAARLLVLAVNRGCADGSAGVPTLYPSWSWE